MASFKNLLEKIFIEYLLFYISDSAKIRASPASTIVSRKSRARNLVVTWGTFSARNKEQ